jgi:hypothetical protein
VVAMGHGSQVKKVKRVKPPAKKGPRRSLDAGAVRSRLPSFVAGPHVSSSTVASSISAAAAAASSALSSRRGPPIHFGSGGDREGQGQSGGCLATAFFARLLHFLHFVHPAIFHRGAADFLRNPFTPFTSFTRPRLATPRGFFGWAFTRFTFFTRAAG